MKRILPVLLARYATLNLKMLRFSLLAVVAAAHLAAQNMLPDAEKQLARDISFQRAH